MQNKALDEKSNFPQICLVQICCKYEICKALQPVQRWQCPNLHKNVQIRPLPHLHCVQSCAKLILATYLHKANLMQIRFSSCEGRPIILHVLSKRSLKKVQYPTSLKNTMKLRPRKRFCYFFKKMSPKGKFTALNFLSYQSGF